MSLILTLAQSGVATKEDVKHFVRTCVKCQSTKSIYKKKYGLYRLLLIPNELWENVSMDFMTQFLEWNGKDTILILVNQFFKLVKMVPTKTITTTFDSTRLLFDMWVKHHGILHIIVSDKDAKFMPSFWKHYFRRLGRNCLLTRHFTHNWTAK